MAPIATGNNVNGTNGHAPAAASAAPAVHHDTTPVNPTSARHEQIASIKVDSPNVKYDEEAITSNYTYRDTHVNVVQNADGTTEYQAKPVTSEYQFKTGRRVPKTG